MLAALLKDLRLLLRDRWLVVFSLLGPMAVITVIAGALLGGGGPRLSLAIVDEDGGPVVRDFKRALADHADVIELPRAEAIRFVRDRNRGPLAIVFPPQLSANHARGFPTEVALLTDPAQEENLRAAKLLLLVMEKQAAAMADPLAEQLIQLKEQNLTGNRLAVPAFDQNLPGFTIMFVLVTVIFSTALGLYNERDFGTLPRLLVTPTGFTSILLGKLGARCILGVVQMVTLLLFARLAFGVSLGSSPLGVAALTGALVFATVATGLLLAGITRSREQLQPLCLAFVVLLSGLGGLWWPTSMAPDWLRSAAPAVYTTWAMRALNDLVLRDRGLAAIAQPVLVVALYGMVVLAAGVAFFRTRSGARS
jgi:ABC-2 type transport system permease protein